MTRLLFSALLMFTLQAPQLDTVTAGAGAAVVKGIKKPAVCQCGPGAVYKPKGKK